MVDFTEFQVDYNDRVVDVINAGYKNYHLALADWIQLVEGSPFSQPVISRLGEGFDFKKWYADGLATVGSMVGSGELDWSRDRSERLKQTLGLVRFLAADPDNFMQFTSSFLWAGSQLQDSVNKINSDIFSPFARDLMRVIERSPVPEAPIPASDRVVTINHNAPEAQQLVTQLADVERSIEESNSLKSDEDYDRNVAEISAGRRLLQASKVRVAAIAEVLVPALKWVASKVGDNVMGTAVTALLVLIAAFFGITIPGLG